jgi:hypothetical protein
LAETLFLHLDNVVVKIDGKSIKSQTMDDPTMPDILCKQDHFASINIKKDHCKQKKVSKIIISHGKLIWLVFCPIKLWQFNYLIVTKLYESINVYISALQRKMVLKMVLSAFGK